MDISEISHYIGQRVRLHRGGETQEEGTVDHVQTVTRAAGARDGDQAREITDGYVLVLDGRKLEFNPGDEFEILDGS